MSTLNIGDKVIKDKAKGYAYTILPPSPGATGSYALVDNANSSCYRATPPPGITTNTVVFLKHPKEPDTLDRWFSAYVEYQRKIKEIIDSDPELRTGTYRMLDFFVDQRETESAYDNNEYWQAFEWVEGGQTLQKYLENPALDESQRITFAKLLIYCVKIFHDAGIVHSDLKPENVMLFEANCKAGYNLRIVDFDRSLIEGQEAPWKDYQGYSGTLGYWSPEHSRNERPTPASDVFTCGIMLYQLLSKTDHPFQYKYPRIEYPRGILDPASAPRPELLFSRGRKADEGLCETLHACLNPDPSKRPTARQLHDALLIWDNSTTDHSAGDYSSYGASPAPVATPTPVAPPAYGAPSAPAATPAFGAPPAPAATPAFGASPAPAATPAFGASPAPAASPAFGAPPVATPAYGASPAPEASPVPMPTPIPIASPTPEVSPVPMPTPIPIASPTPEVSPVPMPTPIPIGSPAPGATAGPGSPYSMGRADEGASSRDFLSARETVNRLNSNFGQLTFQAIGKFCLTIGPLVLAPIDGFGAALAKTIFIPEEARFYDRCQFKLEHTPDGKWFAIPNPNSRNLTLYNWQPLETRTQLRSGGVFAVGSRNPERANVVKGVMKVIIEGDDGIMVPVTPPANRTQTGADISTEKKAPVPPPKEKIIETPPPVTPPPVTPPPSVSEIEKKEEPKIDKEPLSTKVDLPRDVFSGIPSTPETEIKKATGICVSVKEEGGSTEDDWKKLGF